MWALLYAAIALPLAYVIALIALSILHHGYVRVDPVRLRRVSVLLAALVFVGTLLLERLR